MTALPAVLLAVALAQAPNSKLENPIVTKQREKQDLIEKLRHDIFKVDRSVGETEKLIARSRNAPYLPDLQFRLAELYVEKSRYVYYLQAETRSESQKGALVSPETKLLKQKAVQIYNRVLREFPDFKDADKVTFYLAHEQRELGEFDKPPEANMLKTLADLIRKYPSSMLRLDAEQILGDYWFDKSDLKQAEEHYKNILDAPPSPVHDLARYKMGWIRINQAKHEEAVVFFEAAAASPPVPGQDMAKALNVKREALLDLVYSYTEARPAKGAIQYFEKLSESRATFALALDKLGNRYFIKQQFEFAIPALRMLLAIQPDPELEVERVEKLYDSVKQARGKVMPKEEDIGFLVRAAVEVKKDPARDEVARKKTLAELEEMARDLATSIHVQAQKKDDKALYLEAAAAYEKYLSLFRPKQYATVMMQNRADALFAAKRFPEAARQFEELAQYLDSGAARKDGEKKEEKKDEKGGGTTVDVAKDKAPEKPEKATPKDAKLAAVATVATGGPSTKTLGETKTHEEALYGALVSHFSSLKPGTVERLNAFEVADARQALKLLGAQYVGRYPKSEHALEVKFNIARAYYEDGDYKKSAELFKEFALSHSDHKDATVAGNLALDSLRQLSDFKGIEDYGKQFIASNLPAAFKSDVQRILTQTKSEALGELALKSSEETGDVITGLLKVADENKGQEIGEKALYGAFAAARDKRDLRQEKEIGERFLKEYTKSQFISDVMITLGRHAAEAGRYADAAGYFEQMGKQFAGDSTGLDSLISSARLRMAMGDNAGAIKVLENTVEQAGSRKVEVLVMLAQTHMKMKAPSKARAIAEQVMKLDKTNATAAAIIAEVAASTPGEKLEPLVALMTPVANAPNAGGDDVAKGLWYVAEIMYRQFKAIPVDKLEEQVAALQQLQGVYTQASNMGSAEWAVASLWRLGSALQHISDSLESAPPPAGAKPADLEAFRAAVKGQSDQLKEQAKSTFDSCLARAEQLEVFTAAVVGCRKHSEEAASPLHGAPPERAAATEELQKKAEQNQGAADFEALALAYLGAGQLNNAILNLNRAIELEDNRASAHSALGYALVLQGDANAGRAEYGRALEADPTYEKARANLAALRCRFFDKEGAQRELAVIKEPGSIAGPDVDPEWKACK